MTVSSLLERLKAAPVTPVTPVISPGVTAKNTPTPLILLRKGEAVTPVTPVTPQKIESQNQNQKDDAESKPLDRQSMAAKLAIDGCKDCEAATVSEWHGGYQMQCLGCCARLVVSARPCRRMQDGMLAYIDRTSNARAYRRTGKEVLDHLRQRTH